jgi:hypothetical protein
MPDAPEEAQHETSLEELQRQDHELWGKILALQERFSYFFLAASRELRGSAPRAGCCLRLLPF